VFYCTSLDETLCDINFARKCFGKPEFHNLKTYMSYKISILEEIALSEECIVSTILVSTEEYNDTLLLYYLFE
ncbi:hypothetical protein K1T71_009712, partial [Dendrolimus kikuchii]